MWNFADEGPLPENFTSSRLCGAALVSDWVLVIEVTKFLTKFYLGVFRSVELPWVLAC